MFLCIKLMIQVLSSFIDEYCEHVDNGDTFNLFKTQFEEGTMLRRSLDENEGEDWMSYWEIE